MKTAILHVCITCRRENFAGEGETRAGAAMLAALDALPPAANVKIVGIECLSACNHGCAVALSAPGKWSYVYASLDPTQHAPAILDGAARYAASREGLVPWRERPEIFRKQAIARVPPLAAALSVPFAPQE